MTRFAALLGALALALSPHPAQAQNFSGFPASGTVQNGQGTSLPTWTARPVLGVAGTLTGFIDFAGGTSGSTRLQPNATAAGTLTMPAVSDTIAVLGTAQSFTALQTFSSGLALPSAIAPTQITADQNNYSPAGCANANIVRLSSDATRTITGLACGGNNPILLWNTGAFNIILANQSASSTAANRFLFGTDITLPPDGGLTVLYDSNAGTLRWRAWSSPIWPVALGGTGNVTLTNHGVLVGAGTAAITQLAIGGTGTALQGTTGADPSWVTNLQLGRVGGGTGNINLVGNTSGNINVQIQAAAGAYNFNLPTAAGTSGQPLLSGGGGAAAQTYGTLGVAAGGSGQVTLTNHGVLVGAGTAAVTQLAVGASGTVLQGSAAADPAFTATPTLGVAGSVAGTLDFAGATANTTRLQSSGTAGGTLTLPNTNDTLVGRATTDPLTNKTIDTASNTFKLAGTTVNSASAIIDTITAASTQGSVLYRSSTGWSALGPSTAGRVLSTNGAGLDPSWIAVTGTGTVTSVNSGDCLLGGPISTTGTLNVGCTITPQGRLTVTPGTPVVTTGVTGQTTLYYAAYAGRLVPVYDGADMRARNICAVNTSGNCQLSLVLGSNWAANAAFDVFATINAGNVVLCSVAWTNTTTRATSLAYFNALLTNGSSATCRTDNSTTITVAANQGTYLGSFYTNGSTGQIDYSLGGSATSVSLGVCNYYNRVLTRTNITDGGASYTYSSNTIRQRHADVSTTTYQVKYMNCLQEDAVHVVETESTSTVAAAAAKARWGFGLDSTSSFTNSSQTECFAPTAVSQECIFAASTILMPGIGVRTISSNEQGDGVNLNTFNAVVSFAMSATLRN